VREQLDNRASLEWRQAGMLAAYLLIHALSYYASGSPSMEPLTEIIGFIVTLIIVSLILRLVDMLTSEARIRQVIRIVVYGIGLILWASWAVILEAKLGVE